MLFLKKPSTLRVNDTWSKRLIPTLISNEGVEQIIVSESVAETGVANCSLKDDVPQWE